MRLLRETRETRESGGGYRAEGQTSGDQSVSRPRWVRCAACGHAIADEAARIERDGAHVHAFVNPAGIAFTIGCFREAPGCRAEGEESTVWSWFPGFAWTVALCARCGTQLGWLFRGEAMGFFGLIVSRLA
jgi:hypothetical protein